ncbi:DoxX family protein [Kordiimonas sp. SCSIO 12610]|uniref:DoxX family protein n=1 Tax=Kordiimonas sp. SCSIO 12610 TaxID=2829597 RepID=UPI00210B92D1|nr:DoxX family protein [Kordiimonas sp. SCSIO 12610]UTW56562.1 DoxX family protein [Kordiimonas sp. SCSIO 12610]
MGNTATVKTASLAEKIIYWIATGLMAALMLLAIIQYHLNYEVMSGFFKAFGYPTYIVYPLAYLKLIALIAILSNRYRNLKDIAYGAYYINMIAATKAHLLAGDDPIHAYVGLVAIPVSYILSNRVRGEPKRDAFLLK